MDEIDIVKESAIQFAGRNNHHRVNIPAEISDFVGISRGDKIRWSYKNGILKMKYIKKFAKGDGN